ncbi:hypothetical protein XBKB1_2650002 [Xenorhabdus bovienii str. kraussei Becker Underwood]|uniref:Uncharacterized protein n=1 Tax=Xenorhabdus bovienii str. kraussei Becker Underwood TaxID=1398204 RepID=A0A077PUI4_XENBV|nr:hypothetical protein XBKB1_2650002 [Xenorhabdus bovienii str. kraussei Becker Underwood]
MEEVYNGFIFSQTIVYFCYEIKLTIYSFKPISLLLCVVFYCGFLSVFNDLITIFSHDKGD